MSSSVLHSIENPFEVLCPTVPVSLIKQERKTKENKVIWIVNRMKSCGRGQLDLSNKAIIDSLQAYFNPEYFPGVKFVSPNPNQTGSMLMVVGPSKTMILLTEKRQELHEKLTESKINSERAFEKIQTIFSELVKTMVRSEKYLNEIVDNRYCNLLKLDAKLDLMDIKFIQKKSASTISSTALPSYEDEVQMKKSPVSFILSVDAQNIRINRHGNNSKFYASSMLDIFSKYFHQMNQRPNQEFPKGLCHIINSKDYSSGGNSIERVRFCDDGYFLDSKEFIPLTLRDSSNESYQQGFTSHKLNKAVDLDAYVSKVKNYVEYREILFKSLRDISSEITIFTKEEKMFFEESMSKSQDSLRKNISVILGLEFPLITPSDKTGCATIYEKTEFCPLAAKLSDNVSMKDSKGTPFMFRLSNLFSALKEIAERYLIIIHPLAIDTIYSQINNTQNYSFCLKSDVAFEIVDDSFVYVYPSKLTK